MPQSDIPVGTQFSPDLIDLREFCRAVVMHSGDIGSIRASVWRTPVQKKNPGKYDNHPTPDKERHYRLPVEAAIQYGLIDRDTHEATPVARRLALLEPPAIYAEFARHILLRLNGLGVVEGAQQMAMDEPITGIPVTGDSLARYLSEQGLRVGVHNTQINTMRMWLAKAGLFPEGRQNAWKVDSRVKRQLVGLDDAAIAEIASWNEHEQTIAMALCRVGACTAHPASKIRELAEAIHGRALPRGHLAKLFAPLAAAGYVEITSKGTKGGKTALVTTTPMFDSNLLGPFIEHAAKNLTSGLLELYKMSAAEIARDLESTNTHKKGIALEAFAIRLMRLLGLRFIDWRVRARDVSGGAEVDAVLAGMVGGIPTRWQIQCKNTPKSTVRLADVAKEVGVAAITKATHVLIVANASYTADAIRYAHRVMETTSLTIFLLDSGHFKAILDSSGTDLPGILAAQGESSLDRYRQVMGATRSTERT